MSSEEWKNGMMEEWNVGTTKCSALRMMVEWNVGIIGNWYNDILNDGGVE